MLLGWVLPVPDAPGGEQWMRHTIAFVGFMALSLPLGCWGTFRALGPVLAGSTAAARPPTASARPPSSCRCARPPCTPRCGCSARSSSSSSTSSISGEYARYTFDTIIMGALTTCAITYLIAERVLRPVTALALAEGPPRCSVGPGVKGRLLLAWTMASGVPLLGISAVGIDVATPRRHRPVAVALGILVLSAGALSSAPSR